MPAHRPFSLHLDTHPVPVPPSLVQSPYLSSPVFKHDFSAPHAPTEQDELWLQDTVPLPSSSPASSGSLLHSVPPKHPIESHHPAPHSPPIVVNHPTHSPRACANSQGLNQHPPHHPSNFSNHRDLHCPGRSRSLSQPHSPLGMPSRYQVSSQSISDVGQPRFPSRARMCSDSNLPYFATSSPSQAITSNAEVSPLR